MVSNVQLGEFSGLPDDITQYEVPSFLSLQDGAGATLVNKKFKELSLGSVTLALTTIAQEGDHKYSASSLSMLAGGVGTKKARHDALVRDFKVRCGGDEFKERFSAKERTMIDGLLSKGITSLQFASQLEGLAALETNYNYRVLAHKIGTQCGEEGVSYDVLKGKSGKELKALIEGFSGKGNIQELDLHGEGVTALPLGVFAGLGNLQRLDIDAGTRTVFSGCEQLL